MIEKAMNEWMAACLLAHNDSQPKLTVSCRLYVSECMCWFHYMNNSRVENLSLEFCHQLKFLEVMVEVGVTTLDAEHSLQDNSDYNNTQCSNNVYEPARSYFNGTRLQINFLSIDNFWIQKYANQKAKRHGKDPNLKNYNNFANLSIVYGKSKGYKKETPTKEVKGEGEV